MAPRGEKSHLKRSRAQGTVPEDESDVKRPRRSSRLASGSAPEKATVSHQQQLPSPITHLDTFSSSDLARDIARDPKATPIVGNGKFPPPSSQDYGSLSSPPEPTQPFGQSQAPDPQAAIEAVVRDEVKEGVWGYLYPLDSRYKTVVLKKRSSCPPLPAAQVAPATAAKGKQKEDKSPCKSVPSGGYLIGRHPECDIIVDDQVVSNRHCLIFAENKDEQPVAVLEDFSSNGTYVNEAIVGRNQRRELKEHDEIAILGDVRFVFKYPKSRKTSPFQDQFEMLQKLGKGHFAEVFMCVERSSGQRYAVKVFAKRRGDDKSRTAGLQQEIAVLMGVNHENVLCLKDTFDEPDAVRLVLELAPEGELFNFIIRKQKLSEGETRKLFLQLFHGVKYLHDRNIVHRDIKPENILLVDDNLHVKLADFGLAKIIGDESFTTTLCGTPSYVAPEILAEPGRRKYTKAVDIWSLGVVLYICLCGFPPFSDELMNSEFPYSMSQQIKEGRFDYPSPYWDSVGDPALDLIDRMLVVNPRDRYDIDQCLEHPWTMAESPNPNDSTGLIDAIQGLDVGKRRVARERTLLARINSIHMERVPAGDNKRTIAVFNKNKHRVTNVPNAPNPQPRPADDRTAGHFMNVGGVGDPILFDDEADGSIYSKADIAEAK